VTILSEVGELAKITYRELFRRLYEKKMPRPNDLAIGRVIRIEDHGIYVFLEEYELEAYVPLKELSTRFIKHPRELVKLNQKIVVKIYKMRGRLVNASLKRVLPIERQKKLLEWRKLRRSLILMQQMADELGVSIDEVIEKVGKPITEYYDTPYDGFEAAVRWGEEVLEEVGVPKEWIPTIYNIVKSSIKLKEIILKRMLLIRTLAPDGLARIKKALLEGQKIDPNRIEIEYISSPRYLVRIKGYDWKETIKLFNKFFDVVKKNILKGNKWPTEVSYEELEEKKKGKRKE